MWHLDSPMLNKLAQTTLLAAALSACAKPTPEMEAGQQKLVDLRDETMKKCKNTSKLELEDKSNKDMFDATEERIAIILGEMKCGDGSIWICRPFTEESSEPKFQTIITCEGQKWHLNTKGEFVAL